MEAAPVEAAPEAPKAPVEDSASLSRPMVYYRVVYRY
jgi:hypothetical protein